MDPGEIPSDDEKEEYYDEPLMPEPVVEITEAHPDDESTVLSELECMNGLKSVVWNNRGNMEGIDKQMKVIMMAQKEIEALNEISAELQRSLHMEKAKNLQLKQRMETGMKPKLAPIKIKITNGKSVLK